MHLEVDGKRIEQPTAADIARAIPDRSPGDDWSIYLAQDDDNSIEADATEGLRYRIAHVTGGKLFDGVREVDGAELREMFTAYLGGDSSWRKRLRWKEYKGQPKPASEITPAAWKQYSPAVLVPVAALFLYFTFPWFMSAVASLPWPSLPLPPWMDSTAARIFLGFFAACVALFALAVGVKSFEVRDAKGWPKVQGRITKSERGFRIVQPDRQKMPTNERIADIAYSYEVGGSTYTGTRVTFAEKTGEEEVPDLLSRYPAGKSVDVYYDPKAPQSAVLERDMPGELAKGCLAMLAIGLVAIVALMAAVTKGPDVILSVLPNAVVPLFAMFSIGGGVMLALAVSLLRSVFEARSWPKVFAKITKSEVHDFEMVRARSKATVNYGSRTTTSYMPVIEYTYRVAGRDYTSRSMRLDTEVAGSKAYADRLVAKYPAGKTVPAYYDPRNPERAALEITSGMGWFILVLALLLLAVAVWASGYFASEPPLKLGQ